MHQAAIGRVRDTFAPDAVGPLCAMLPRLPEPSQIALIAALSGFPRERVLPAILEAARSNTPEVRLAALGALPAVGDATTVSMLLETAARARGPEQAAARAALNGLKGHAVDEALLAELTKKPAGGQEVELLIAVAERRIYPARPAVASFLASDSSKTRQQALKTLRAIGTPSDIPAILNLVVKTADDVERSEAEATVSALAQKVSRADQRAREVKTRLVEEKDAEVRARLLGLLAMVGDASTLPMLRAALGDANADVRDAAVRAITGWPTNAARDDVFRLARDARNETHRLLAIQGLIRIIGLDRYRDPQAAVADLRLAAGFAWRAEEQKLVLGALGQFPCTEALDLATGFLQEPAVKAEAQAAVEKIQKALKS
jgi:HEAT repeat protein